MRIKGCNCISAGNGTEIYPDYQDKSVFYLSSQIRLGAIISYEPALKV